MRRRPPARARPTRGVGDEAEALLSLRYADALRALRAVNASDALILEGVHSFWISCQARESESARDRAFPPSAL